MPSKRCRRDFRPLLRAISAMANPNRTKDLRTANVRAKPVLAGFDRVLREAAALQAPKSTPALRTSLNAAEIARMSEALYGKLLADDEASRFGGRARVAEGVEWIRRNENPDFQLPYPIESVREHGWHPEILAIQREHMVHELATMQEALALGDITAVEDDVALLLADFEINLDRKSVAYRENLGRRHCGHTCGRCKQ